MTSRARCLAILGLAGLAYGMVRMQPVLSLLCLSLLLWMLWEWVAFHWNVRRELACLSIRRTVNGRDDRSGVVWADRRINIDLHLSCEPHAFQNMRCFRDVVPENLRIESLDNASILSTKQPSQGLIASIRKISSELFEANRTPEPENQLSITQPVSHVCIAFQAIVRAAGEFTLPGVRIEFRDPMRLYRADRFVPHSQTYRVLPKFTAAGDATPNIKRLNAIPRQGIHRQQRAGVGFELLELREYLEGDPPKAIAWKASARRDKLMTRQYESEVPLRVQLIVDGTSSTRIGGFGLRLIDQITHASGSIAHSVTKVGDAIGAYLVDDQHIERVPASSGTIGFYALMRRLGDFSKNRNPPSRRLTPQLLESAYAVMSERFPDLLEPSINPIAMHWLRSFPRRGERQRIQLANAMAHIHGLSLNQQVNLMTDDSALAQRLAIFLSECGMPWIAPIAYPADADSFHSSERIHLLSKSILSAISNAHDNEVLVIIAELLGNEMLDGGSKRSVSPKLLEEFFQVAGIAKAKHHRVMVLLPSPTFQRPQKNWNETTNGVQELRIAAEHIRLRELAMPLQKRLSKLGIPSTMSGEPRATRLVLSEIEIARSGRLTVSGRGR